MVAQFVQSHCRVGDEGEYDEQRETAAEARFEILFSLILETDWHCKEIHVSHNFSNSLHLLFNQIIIFHFQLIFHLL